MRHFFTLCCCLFFFCHTAFGHGGLDQRIIAKTAAILKTPKQASLYLERGFLYQQHEAWDKALADYLHAQQLGLTNKVLYFRMAELYLALGLVQSGLHCTQQYLAQDTLDVKIHHLRGELFYRANNYPAAITAFQYVLDKAHDVTPENYLTLAAVYLAKSPNQADSVLWVIEQGLERLGTKVFVLQEQKLYYLQHFEQTTATLQQYDVLLAQLTRKERWQYKKAHYLYEQGQYNQAKESLQMAQEAFEQLKAHQQQTKAMLRLLAKIHQLSEKLES